MAVDVKLTRLDRVYRPPDVVDGSIVITTPTTLSHQGIKITAAGNIMLQLSAKSMGVFEALYSSVKPIQLMNKTIDISPAGKLPAGRVELPFHISLDPQKGGISDNLYETYHGAYVHIKYTITAEISRGYLQKALTANAEFIMEAKKGLVPRSVPSEYVTFYITQDTQHHALLPAVRAGGFRISGKVATQCLLSETVTGDLTVDSSGVPILSIDIQLLRIESIAAGDRMATEKTDIQTTQIADGNVCRGLLLPIYVVLPRLCTCPTLSAGSFSLEFELSVVITFDVPAAKQSYQLESQTPKPWLAKENIPLTLFRA